MIAGASLGAEFADACIDTLSVHAGIQEAWSYLSQLIGGAGISVALIGPCGTGKTRMLATVLHECETKWPEKRYVYWPLPKFVAARRAAIGGDRMDPAEGCIKADICVLDDLGAEKASDWGLEGLYRVIDERRNARRITLIASNLEPKGLQEVYGARIVSRLTGKHQTMVRVKGDDQRLRQALALEPIQWADGEEDPQAWMRPDPDSIPMPEDVAEQIRALGKRI